MDDNQTTGYSIDALRNAYSAFNVQSEAFYVETEEYEAIRTSKERNALGGARALVTRSNTDEALLVSNRGEDGWDIPGGAQTWRIAGANSSQRNP